MGSHFAVSREQLKLRPFYYLIKNRIFDTKPNAFEILSTNIFQGFIICIKTHVSKACLTGVNVCLCLLSISIYVRMFVYHKCLVHQIGTKSKRVKLTNITNYILSIATFVFCFT